MPHRGFAAIASGKWIRTWVTAQGDNGTKPLAANHTHL